MNYLQARAYLNNISSGLSAKHMSLDAIRVLLDHLGNPQNKLKFVHIAGTNGKGSTLAFLDKILQQAGYRTGRYQSPALFSYEEEFLSDGNPISKEKIAEYITKIALVRSHISIEGGPPSTVFEVETAMAFLWFLEMKCDIVLLECGMGGKDDATNIENTSILELFSPISVDHAQFLGNTPEKIAFIKSGIILPHTEVVSAMQTSEVIRVLRAKAASLFCLFTVLDPSKIEKKKWSLKERSYSYQYCGKLNVTIHLAGEFQFWNSALAIEGALALRRLGWDISDSEIERGLAAVRYEGRFTIIRECPYVIIDGAHNPEAAAMLMRTVDLYFAGKTVYYIFGILRDKDYKKVISLTAARAKKIFTVQSPNNPRALPAVELKMAVEQVNPNVEACDSVSFALISALQTARTQDVILCFGSMSWLYLVKNYFVN